MFTIEELTLYVSVFAVLITFATFCNAVKARRQDLVIKKQDLAFKELETQDRFRYHHPHMYVDLISSFSDVECLYKPECKLVIANRDPREVFIEGLRWSFSNGSTWPITGSTFEPCNVALSEKLEYKIDPDEEFFPFGSNKSLSMIYNILDLSLQVTLSTDRGRMYPLNNFSLQRYLIYKKVKPFPMRWLALYMLCKEHKVSVIQVII